MGRARSIGDVAKTVGLAVDAMTYRVKRLVALGILEEVRKEARKGRAIAYYQAATAFFVPIKVLPHETTEDLFEHADGLMRRQIAKSMTAALYDAFPFQDWGVLVQCDSNGNPGMSLAPPSATWDFADLLSPQAPALMSSWMPLMLEFEDAKALQAELFALLGRYAQKQGTQPYLLGLALAPR